LATTTNAVSAHYIIFYYNDALGANNDYRFVVLPSATTAPTTYAAIGDYDGHITLRAKKTERAGLIFLPGNTSLDSDGVPNDTLAASTTFKLYAANAVGEKEGDAVKELTVKTGARGPESPFRVRRNGSLLTRIYVGKRYGIVPFSEYVPARYRTSIDPLLRHKRGTAAIVDMSSGGLLAAKYDEVANLVVTQNTAKGVLLFLNSTDGGVHADARNLGGNSTIEVSPAIGGADEMYTHRLKFSDDAENQRSITNESGFATSPAVD